MIIQEPIQAAIWHCLNHYDYQNAVFLAERLCVEVETDETIFLLATCYYRSNQIHQAYWLLKTKLPRTPQSRYLLAKCAYQLKKLIEAESAISTVNLGDIKNFEEIINEFGEVACFVLQLIAKICSQTERKQAAIEANKRALKLNPFLWNSFVELCNWGEKCDPNAIFQFSSNEIFNTCQGNGNTNSMILFGSGNYLNYINMIETGGINGNYYSTGDIINNCTSSNYNNILSTPIDTNMQTPNNNINFHNINNNSNNNINNINNNTTNIYRTGIGYPFEDTPILYSDNLNNSHQFIDNGTPFRKPFKYLSTISPGTPSFGVLPISPRDNTSFTTTALITSNTTQVQTHSPPPQTLVEVNQDQKSLGNKKLKGNIGSILNRKDSTITMSKPAVFTQTGNITPRTPNCGNGNGQNVRRSSRLFSNNNYSVKENTGKSPIINKFVQPRSPPRKSSKTGRLSKLSLNSNSEIIISNQDIKKDRSERIETITSDNSQDTKVLLNNSFNNAQTIAHHVLSLKKQSAEGLMSLLREFGTSYLFLSQYNCAEAIVSFKNVSSKRHLASSWVQSMIAVALYELRNYDAAVDIFKQVHHSDPYRLQCMEIYSTSLWHLQREVALSALAQDLMSQDKHSAITWCVAGNCFSLHKEHETAIKFFKRAVQVEPEFVYSYTLLGHELVITEELEKAMTYFRMAILKDPRHYNAWFGIGTIYSKQERYELAELHYRRSLKINPKNSVIIVHIGAMQYFMHRSEQALQTLNLATAVDPKNPLCKFHRGSIYYSLGKYPEALKELEELKQIVPKESVVFYLIGKIHKTLGNLDKALMHFSWATDLDPKGANNQLKDAFDTINHTNAHGQIEPDLELLDPISERSDDSTQAQNEPDATYDSDSY